MQQKSANTLKWATFANPKLLGSRQTDKLLTIYEVISPSYEKFTFFVFVVQIPRVMKMTVGTLFIVGAHPNNANHN